MFQLTKDEFENLELPKKVLSILYYETMNSKTNLLFSLKMGRTGKKKYVAVPRRFYDTIKR